MLMVKKETRIILIHLQQVLRLVRKKGPAELLQQGFGFPARNQGPKVHKTKLESTRSHQHPSKLSWMKLCAMLCQHLL